MSETTEVPTQQESGSDQERIEPRIVQEIAEDFGHFYDLPAATVEKAAATQAYIVSTQRFLEIKQDATNDLYDEILRRQYSLDSDDPGERAFAELAMEALKEEHEVERQRIMALVKDPRRLPEAEFFDRKDGTKQVIVHDKAIGQSLDLDGILRHEMIHALASRGFAEGGGFRDRMMSPLPDTALCEAGVEVLRIARQFPMLEPRALAVNVHKKEIAVGYPPGVTKLLLAMGLTYDKGGQPVSIADLASAYFNKDGENPAESSHKFQLKLLEGAPIEKSDYAFRWIQELSGIGSLLKG